MLREFEIKTGGRLDAVDVTDDVLELVIEAGIETGNVLVFSPHTTCCILVARSAADTVAALEATMETIAPAGGYYLHDDLEIRTENLVEDEPANAPAHIAHIFLGKTSECVPVVEGRPLLGEDQRVFFVELDASRPRRYYVQVLGE